MGGRRNSVSPKRCNYPLIRLTTSAICLLLSPWIASRELGHGAVRANREAYDIPAAWFLRDGVAVAGCGPLQDFLTFV